MARGILPTRDELRNRVDDLTLLAALARDSTSRARYDRLLAAARDDLTRADRAAAQSWEG